MPLKSAFLAGVLATVPEAERGKAETELIALEEGNLRQADYSKNLADTQAAKKAADDLYASNKEWFDTRQKDLAELDDLRAKVAAGIVKQPVVTDPLKPQLPEGIITKKEVLDILDTTERGAVAFISEANTLTMKHYKEFGEILNITELLADKRVQQIGLQGVYQDKFKEQIAAKVKAADDAKAEAYRKEGRDQALKDVAGRQHPYPVVGNETSSLDAIEASTRTGDKVTVKSLDEISAEYARLGAVRAGVGT